VELRNTYQHKILVRKPEEGKPPDEDGRIILKFISRKSGVTYVGFLWLRTGSCK
jgi:hypothetical protein